MILGIAANVMVHKKDEPVAETNIL